MSWDKTLVTAQPTFEDEETDVRNTAGIDPAWFERPSVSPQAPPRPLWITRDDEEEPEPLLDLATLLEPKVQVPVEPAVPTPTVEEETVEPAGEPGKRGKIVVFFGCRGGCGTTTLAVNMASVLARGGQEICVVDLDLLLGDVLVTLDLEAKFSVTAMARDGVTMDGAALRRRLQRHASGFYALAQNGRIDDMDSEIAERVPDLMRVLAQQFDVVLVDGLRDFSDHAVAALDAADQVALVLTQDVPSVRRAARVVELCRKLGYDGAKLRLVVNRHSAGARVTLPEVERALALPVAACVTNDYRATSAAQDAGGVLIELRPRSRVARDLAALAAGLLRRDDAPSTRPLGFWARLLGRNT